MMIINYLLSEIIFWMAWVIIPLIMEILPAMFNFLVLIKKKVIRKKEKDLEYYPNITLIIPVYNSEASLKACIQSIYESDYLKSSIHVMLINNESKDQSFQVFIACQQDFPELSMTWLNAKQGKSKALNYALFNSEGKYIIHIDSDGKLHSKALKNIVTMFENNEDVHCVTGTIMTNPEAIEHTKGFLKRFFYKMEFFEYCQAFLAGRNFEAEFNSIYTLSGAFSAFRKSTILKTQLYNTDTVCEDTHVTFQVREFLKKKVRICDKAFFFVDPIEDINKLYTQRQRWQRGEMEVAHMFLSKSNIGGKKKVSHFVTRLLMYDHTFAFPRMIWYFALICLGFMNYSFSLIVSSVVMMYLLYVISTFLYYINIVFFLESEKVLQRYYRRKWYMIFVLPLYNFVIFWFRFAGMINAIKGTQTWRTRNLTEEWQAFRGIVKNDFMWMTRLIKILKVRVNKDEE